MFNIMWKILVFAIAFTFFYAWGYVKQQRKNQELFDKLIKKSEERILKDLKKKEFMTIKEIEKIIDGTKASLFWSKQKIQVQDPKLIIKTLIPKMKMEKLIIEKMEKGAKRYYSFENLN